MIDLITQPAALVPSSRPWPDRDWESMPGAFLDQSTIQSMRADSLHRDIHREEARLEAWEMVHEQHLWAREHNPGTPPDTGIYLFSADMGACLIKLFHLTCTMRDSLDSGVRRNGVIEIWRQVRHLVERRNTEH